MGLGEQIRLCLRIQEPNRYFFPKYKNWLIAQKQLTLPENERRFIHPKDIWDGYYKFHFGNRFPTGLLHIVTDFLDRSEVTYSVKQAYTSPTPSDDISLIDFTPREYQLETIKKALELKRAVIQLPTNAGKSLVAFAILKAFQPNQFIYLVHLKNLLYQTRDKMREQFGFEPGIVGDGIVDLRPEGNIVMLQSINDALLDKLKNSPIMVIDECHHSVQKEWYKIAMKIQSPVRYGLSATPLGLVYSDWKLMALCGPIIGEITNKELIDLGFSTRPFIEIYKIKLPEFEPATVNAENEETTKMARYQQLLEFLFSSSIRNARISRIVRKYSDKSTMVMVSRKAHGCELRRLIPGSEFICGEDSTEIRKDALKRFKVGELKVLISTLFGEGTDIPNIEVLVFSYPISFDRPLLQRIGRGLRKGDGKDEVRIIDFDDTCSHHLQKALEQRKEVYNNEGFVFEYYEEGKTEDPFT